jgi:hypothetical protein
MDLKERGLVPIAVGSSSQAGQMALKRFENYWLDHGEIDDRGYSRLILPSGSEPESAEPPLVAVATLIGIGTAILIEHLGLLP